MNTYLKTIKNIAIVSIIVTYSLAHSQKPNSQTIKQNNSKTNINLEKKINQKDTKFHPSIKVDLNCDGILDSVIVSTDNTPFFYIKTSRGYKKLDTKTMCLEDGTTLSKKSYYNNKK